MDIKELRRAHAALLASAKSLHAADSTDEGMSEEQAAEFETTTKKIDVLATKIERAEKMLDASAKSARKVHNKDVVVINDEGDEGDDVTADPEDMDDAAVEDMDDEDAEEKTVAVSTKSLKTAANIRPFNVSKGLVKVDQKPGDAAVLMMMAQAYKNIERTSDRNVARWMQKNFSGHVHEKTLSATLTSVDTGHFAIPQSYLPDLISYLRSRTVMRQVGVRIEPMPTGNLLVPRQSGTTTGYWVNELDPITPSDITLDDVVLNAKKLAALSTASNSLIRRSPLVIANTIREDLTAQIARAEDLAFIRGSGSSQPGSIKSLAATTITASAADWKSVVGLVYELKSALESANVPMNNTVWLMNPAVKNFLMSNRSDYNQLVFPELLNDVLVGYPVFTTTQIPTNIANVGASGNTHGSEIYFFDASQYIIGDTYMPTLEVDSFGAWEQGGAVKSAMSRDVTIFRIIEECDAALSHPEAAAVGLVDSYLPGLSS